MAGIKRRIVLEGEKEYNAAIKEAQRNLKTLRSELKAETAELGTNATAQQKNETRAKSLQKQIKEQEKVVKTLQTALEAAKEEYGDNEEVVAKWEQKLNDARATLANMKNDLEGTNQAVRDTGNSMKEAASSAAETVTATKNVADALGEIGAVGDSVAGAIENVFTGMIDTLERTISAAWEMVSATAAKANSWTDIAGYWGTDAQTIQQYARAVSASANSFEDLNSAVSRIVLGGKGKKITEMLGVSDVNYENEWSYAMAVLDRMYQLKQSGTDLNPIYEEIFGEKRATKMMDLLNDWGDIQKNLKTFNGNESGYGMTDEGLETMNQLWVDINRIDEKYNALKEKFAEGLGTATGTLLVNVEGSLDALADFMKAETPEEREAALESLRTNVEEFFTKVADILREGIAILNEVGIELQGSDDPMTALIGDILVKMTGALQWMVDNQNAVKGAFETIFGVWLLAKLAAVAGKLSSVLVQIEAIKAFKGISTTASAAEAAGSAAGASWAAGFGAAALKALPWLVGLGVALAPDTSGDEQQDAFYLDGKVTKEGRSRGLPETQEEYDAWTAEQKADWESRNNWKPGNEIVDAVSGAAPSFGPPSPIEEHKETWAAIEALQEGRPLAEEAQEGKTATGEALEYYRWRSDKNTMEDKALAAYLYANRPEETAEPPKGEHFTRRKNITGTATEEQMQGAAEREAAEIATMESTLEGIYQALNDHDLDESGRSDAEYFGEELLPLIRQAAQMGGAEDQAEAIAEAFQQKWHDSMYDDEWEGDTSGLVNMLEEAIQAAAQGITAEQQEAAEALWDVIRGEDWENMPDVWETVMEAFAGQDDLFAKLDALIDEMSTSTGDDSWKGVENLPANWWLDAANWQNREDKITSADLQNFRGLPENMAKAVEQATAAGAASGAARGVSGIQVHLDGYTVGRLVAPYVSEMIARDIIV